MKSIQYKNEPASKASQQQQQEQRYSRRRSAKMKICFFLKYQYQSKSMLDIGHHATLIMCTRSKYRVWAHAREQIKQLSASFGTAEQRNGRKVKNINRNY